MVAMVRVRVRVKNSTTKNNPKFFTNAIYNPNRHSNRSLPIGYTVAMLWFQQVTPTHVNPLYYRQNVAR